MPPTVPDLKTRYRVMNRLAMPDALKFHHLALRRKIFGSIEELQSDLRGKVREWSLT